jgi:lipopolysaccharide export system permease protein
MRILSRYILKEVSVFFGISLLTFTGLLLTLRMLKLTSLIVNRGVEFGQIATVFIAIIPTFLEIALPMSALLGVMLAFTRMCGDSEVVVFKASGVGLAGFIKPLAGFALTIGLLSLIVSCILRPWGFNTLSNALFDIARSKSTSGLSEGVFNKLGGNITLYSERVDYSTGELFHVLVDDKRDPAQQKVVIAKKGAILADPDTQTISLLLGDGVAHEALKDRYSRTAFVSNIISIDPDELRNDNKKGVSAREVSTGELRKLITEYKTILRANNPSEESQSLLVHGQNLSRQELQKKFRRAKVEHGQRFSLPCASIIMTFLGFAIGIISPRTQRSWGAGLAATLGLIVFMLYYGIFSLGLALADGGKMHVGLALWLPNIVAASIAFVLVRKITTEQWSSVSEGIINLIAGFAKKALNLIGR